HFASPDRESLELAAKLGARPLETDFSDKPGRFPIVVDAGVTQPGLAWALRATEPEGTYQSISFHAGPPVPLPLGRMYTLGMRCFIGRCHAAAVLPEVVALIEGGRLRPQEITTRVVDWDDVLEAWPEPAIKLVARRD